MHRTEQKHTQSINSVQPVQNRDRYTVEGLTDNFKFPKTF